jgi:hypothetical protein
MFFCRFLWLRWCWQLHKDDCDRGERRVRSDLMYWEWHERVLLATLPTTFEIQARGQRLWNWWENRRSQDRWWKTLRGVIEKQRVRRLGHELTPTRSDLRAWEETAGFLGLVGICMGPYCCSLFCRAICGQTNWIRMGRRDQADQVFCGCVCGCTEIAIAAVRIIVKKCVMRKRVLDISREYVGNLHLRCTCTGMKPIRVLKELSPCIQVHPASGLHQDNKTGRHVACWDDVMFWSFVVRKNVNGI